MIAEYASYSPPLVYTAKNNVKTPDITEDKESYYEHRVGSWACTALKSYFITNIWIITPEKGDPNSKKRPDLVVEKVNTVAGKRIPYLIMELKSKTGDRFEDALNQTINEITDTMDMTLDAYIVIQKGTRIRFFEYPNDIDPEKNILPHFKKCLSIMQGYQNDTNIVAPVIAPLQGALPLYHDTKFLKKKKKLKYERKLRLMKYLVFSTRI